MRIHAIALLVMAVLCLSGGVRADAVGVHTLYTLGISLDQQGGVAGGWTRVGAKGAWKNTLAGAILRGRLYTVELSGVLYETDLSNGNWKPIGKPEFGNTAFMFAANDALYTIETGGGLYKVNPEDGSWEAVSAVAAWKNTIAGTILDNHLYTTESSGAMYVTDLDAGTWKQIGKAEFRDTAAMVAANGALYTIQADGNLYAVNIRDGAATQVGAAHAWKRSLARVAHHNQLITAESDGSLIVSNLKTGERKPIGQHEFGNTRHMFATTDGLYTIETDGSLYHVYLKPGGGIAAYDWCPAEIEKVFREQGKAFYHQCETGQINGEKATRAGIMVGFGWLKDSAKKDDLAVIYVGCHGSTDPEQGWGVVTADGQMLWGNEIKAALAKLSCQVIIMVETCTSGGFAVPHKNDMPLPANVTALCACSAAQTTDNQLDIALAEGLYGRADFDKDGIISLDELIRYIPLRYKEWWPNPTGTDGSQTPVIVKSPGLPGTQPLTSVSPALAAINYQGTLHSALLEGQDGANYHVHLLGWSSEPGKPYFLTNLVTRDSLCLPTEEVPLLVEQHGKWLPARLVTQTADKFKIHYLGTNREDTVPSNRIKYPFVGQTTK